MRKSLYTYPHKSRQAKVDYICGIGGYCTWHNRYPIEFCVRLYDVDNDFDSIWKEILKQNPQLPEDPDCASLRVRAGMLWAEKSDSYYQWAQECAARSLSEEDCDAYHMLWDGTKLDVKLALEGRGGKHLVITEFEGHSLSHTSSEALAEAMMERYEYGGWSIWPTEDVNKLYKYVRQCEVDFTPQKASAEVTYLMSSDLYLDAEQALDEQRQSAADAAKIRESAKLVENALGTTDYDTFTAWGMIKMAAGIIL